LVTSPNAEPAKLLGIATLQAWLIGNTNRESANRKDPRARIESRRIRF